MSEQKCTAALVWAKCIVHCSELLCRTGSQQACVTAITPMEICSSYRCAVSQQKCTAALGKAECSVHCSKLCRCNYTRGSLLFIQVCSDPSPVYCNTVCSKQHSHCLVLLCKTDSQKSCVGAITPVEVCSSCRCAMTQNQCTETLFLANIIPHCFEKLCKTGSQQVVLVQLHYGDPLFIQVCSDPTPVH